MGVLPLAGWFTKIDGYVFNDTNRNGKRDAGEPGVPELRPHPAQARELADGPRRDRGQHRPVRLLRRWRTPTRSRSGSSSRRTTTATTRPASPTRPTTSRRRRRSSAPASTSASCRSSASSGTLDWGVHAYDATGTNGVDPQNGGIVGSISYDTTRNELDPQYAAAEDWQPGVSGLTVELYAPVPCGTNAGDAVRRARRLRAGTRRVLRAGQAPQHLRLRDVGAARTDCVARDVDGNPLVNPADQQVLPVGRGQGLPRRPADGRPVRAVRRPTRATPDANFGAAVDGNYGFGDALLRRHPRRHRPVRARVCVGGTLRRAPARRTTTSSTSTSPARWTRRASRSTRSPAKRTSTSGTATVRAAGPAARLRRSAPHGGRRRRRHDGYARPSPTRPATAAGPHRPGLHADREPDLRRHRRLALRGPAAAALRHEARRRSRTASRSSRCSTSSPTCRCPGRFFAYNVDDLNFSTDPKSLLFGEKAGMPFAPVGIYDFANRLVTTVETDYNGLFDVLLPSTNRINCPTPSGVCANLYRFVGNDPGVPGRLNPNYNPQYRTIAAEFEAFPGLIVPADTAPTQVGVIDPAAGRARPRSRSSCPVNDPAAAPATRTPGAVRGVAAVRDRGRRSPGASRATGFGALRGHREPHARPPRTGAHQPADRDRRVDRHPDHDHQLHGARAASWAHQLRVTAGNGRTTINGLTFHRIGRQRYNPPIFEVGPGQDAVRPGQHAARDGRPRDPAGARRSGQLRLGVQRQLQQGRPGGGLPEQPRPATRVKPARRLLREPDHLQQVKLQGVGPGSPDGSVRGLDHRRRRLRRRQPGGDRLVRAGSATLNWAGNQTIYDGAVISIYVPTTPRLRTAERRRPFPTTFNADDRASIDGFDLRGGDQMGFPGNINEIGGVPTGLPGRPDHPGRRDLRQRLRPQPADHEQRRSRTTAARTGPSASARRTCPRPTPTTRTTTSASPTTGSSPTAARTWPAASASSPAATATSSPATTSAATSRPSTAAASASYGLSPNGSIDHNRIYYNQSLRRGRRDHDRRRAAGRSVDPLAGLGRRRPSTTT